MTSHRPARPTQRQGLLWPALLGVLFLLGAAAAAAQAQALTVLLDSNGDGTNTLDGSDVIALDPFGNLYVAGSESDNVFRVATDGTITEIIDRSGDGLGNTLITPLGLTTDSNGNVFVSGFDSWNVFRIAKPDGCSTSGTPCTITEIMDRGEPEQFRFPYELITDDEGNVYVTSTTNLQGNVFNAVFKINTPDNCGTGEMNTACTITKVIGSSVTSPRNLAFDADGTLYVSAFSSDEVVRVSISGDVNVITAAGDSLGHVFDGPWQIVLDGAGNLYVASLGGNNVFRVDDAVNCGFDPCIATEIMDATGDRAGNTLSAPTALKLDGAGNLYVAGEFSRNVFKIEAPDTCDTTFNPCTITEVLDQDDAEAGTAFDNPTDMEFDAAGRLMINSQSNIGDFIFSVDFSPLPVELVAFDATADGDAAVLTWRTASETNNAGFEVQHFDGGAWQARAFVEGHGTTAAPQAYTYRLDGLEPGTHRFRLKQIDFDGAVEVSPVVEVSIAVPGAFSLGAAYPNPFNPQTTFRLSVARTQRVTVAVYDVLGRRVALLYRGLLAGGRAHPFRFDATGLPGGLYLIDVTGEVFHATRPVMLVQ